MPELPEVETVKNTLKRLVLNENIVDVNVVYPNILANFDKDDFRKKVIGQTIIDIKRRGKWLMFELDHYYLLSHLRMEGKYFLKKEHDPLEKHEHLVYRFLSGQELRYNDTRKFGRIYLMEKDNVYNVKPLSDLGLEPFDSNLNISYLKEKYKNKKTHIKTLLLDQSIITGIGNIYADEILFLSNINPLKEAMELSDKELNLIIKNTRDVLNQAIMYGGTTIKSYESQKGVHGRFQQQLLVHGKKDEVCVKCNTKIEKIRVNGRGTYYCKKCQK